MPLPGKGRAAPETGGMSGERQAAVAKGHAAGSRGRLAAVHGQAGLAHLLARGGEERAEAVRELQRRYGNRRVQRMLARLAEQRSGDPNQVSPDVTGRIAAQQGSGRPLAGNTRAEMEGAFGHDFGDVRVHTGTQADALNQEVKAQAFTTGRDIFFRGSNYSPGTTTGKELLAHELTHVVQQGGASASAAGPARVTSPNEASEVEAARVAQAVIHQGEVARQPQEEEELQMARQPEEEELQLDLSVILRLTPQKPAGFTLAGLSFKYDSAPPGGLSETEKSVVEKVLGEAWKEVQRDHSELFKQPLPAPEIVARVQLPLRDILNGYEFPFLLERASQAMAGHLRAAVLEQSRRIPGEDGPEERRRLGIIALKKRLGQAVQVIQNYQGVQLQFRKDVAESIGNWLVAGVSAGMGGQAWEPPDVDIWDPSLRFVGLAYTYLGKGLIEDAEKATGIAHGEIERARIEWNDWLEAAQLGAERTVKYVLKPAVVAGAIAATVVTAGAAAKFGAAYYGAGTAGAVALGAAKGGAVAAGAGVVAAGGAAVTVGVAIGGVSGLLKGYLTELSLMVGDPQYTPDWDKASQETVQGVIGGAIDGLTGVLALPTAKITGALVGKETLVRLLAAEGLAGGALGLVDGMLRAIFVDRERDPQKILSAGLVAAGLGAALGPLIAYIFGIRAVPTARGGRVPTVLPPKAAAATPAAATLEAPRKVEVPRGPVVPRAVGEGRPRVILEKNFVEVKDITEGMNEGKKYFRDRYGNEWLFKPQEGEYPGLVGEDIGIVPRERYRRAPAAAEMAEMAGLPAPEAALVEFQDAKGKKLLGSLQRWVRQGKTLEEIRIENPMLYKKIMNSQMKKDLDTFDYLIANVDRNTGNLKVVFDEKTGDIKKLVPIDNDIAFPPSDVRHTLNFDPNYSTSEMDLPETISPQLHRRLMDMGKNRAGLKRALSWYLTPPEVEGVLARLDQILGKAGAGVIQVK